VIGWRRKDNGKNPTFQIKKGSALSTHALRNAVTVGGGTGNGGHGGSGNKLLKVRGGQQGHYWGVTTTKRRSERRRGGSRVCFLKVEEGTKYTRGGERKHRK